MAGGFFLLNFAFGKLGGAESTYLKSPLVKWLPPVLVVLGFCGLLFEAGRPWRIIYLLNHLRRSWISRETLIGLFFVACILLDMAFPRRGMDLLAAGSAMGLVISQGFIVYRSRALLPWNTVLVPLFFVTSAFTTGFALILLTLVPLNSPLGHDQVLLGLILLCLDLFIWFFYLYGKREPAFKKATTVLRTPFSLALTAGLGRFAPIVVISFLLLVSENNKPIEFGAFSAGFTALAIILGGGYQKARFILGTNYLRAITLSKPGYGTAA